MQITTNLPPDSKTSTRSEGSSVRREARTHPAVPDKTSVGCEIPRRLSRTSTNYDDVEFMAFGFGLLAVDTIANTGQVRDEARSIQHRFEHLS